MKGAGGRQVAGDAGGISSGERGFELAGAAFTGIFAVGVILWTLSRERGTVQPSKTRCRVNECSRRFSCLCWKFQESGLHRRDVPSDGPGGTMANSGEQWRAQTMAEEDNSSNTIASAGGQWNQNRITKYDTIPCYSI